MTEDPTLEAILSGGLEALINPADARRKAGRLLPVLVARRLSQTASNEDRRKWGHDLLHSMWPAVQKERGERWDLGWAELVAGLALASELLDGDLPPAIRISLKGTPAESLWLKARAQYQRFVLLVDSEVHVRRLFTGQAYQSVSGVRIEDSLPWSVDGPPFRDRSHTLMLGLLSHGIVPDNFGPVAATGELLGDGVSIAPVAGFMHKATEWWTRFPTGLLISAPVDDLGEKDWAALARHVDGGQELSVRNWIVAASLDEVRAKLATGSQEVANWDGTLLPPNAQLHPSFRSSGEAPPRIAGTDLLVSAAFAASREARSGGQRRGVLVEGRPGAGKSVLSILLERRFARGPLSALGLGIRRRARDLAKDISKTSGGEWSAVLEVSEPNRAALFRGLEKTGRLVPIVDGLDEVSAAELLTIADWLRRCAGWWIATSRPLASIEGALLSNWRLAIEDLNSTDVKGLLNALGRQDLADRNLATGSSGGHRCPLEELTLTPLHVALLAKVVPPEQDPGTMDVHTLYESAFQGLLVHACCSGRTTTEGAGLAQRLLSSVAGELALSWLKSDQRPLQRDSLEATFYDMGMGVHEQQRSLEALTFGHLLVPAGTGYDFAHRTLAEWAAAHALQRRVVRGLRGLNSAELSSTLVRAEVEWKEVGFLLDGDVLPEQGPLATLLRFYIPLAAEPMALLDRLLGPAHVTKWRSRQAHRLWTTSPVDPHSAARKARSSEILQSWSFAFELLRTCRNWGPEDARLAWALAVRRWLLPASKHWKNGAMNAFRVADDVESLERFAEAVDRFLPKTLTGLADLAAGTDAQRVLLGSRPELLLPAVPAGRSEVLVELLRSGGREQQLAVLKWFAGKRLEVPREVLDTLLSVLPAEADKALDARTARFSSDPAAPQSASDRVDDLLPTLEAAVWEAFLTSHTEPLWAAMRHRLYSWPAHLDTVFLKWFAELPAPSLWSDGPDESRRRRREILAAFYQQSVDEEDRFGEVLSPFANTPAIPRVLGRLKYRLECEADEWALCRLLDSLATARGWTVGPASSRTDCEHEDVVENARRTVLRLHKLRTRTARICGSFEQSALDDIVGELWKLLPPGDAARSEILRSLKGDGPVPRQISALDVIVHHGGVHAYLSNVQWTREHIGQLEELSHTARGEVRYMAVVALAHARGTEEFPELVRCFPCSDAEFESLLQQHPRWRDSTEWIGVSVDAVASSKLPLAARVDGDMPGWRADLLASMAGNASADMGELVSLAVRHEVREALPLMVQALPGNKWNDRILIEGIALLATEEDTATARIALLHALQGGWPADRSSLGHSVGLGGREPGDAGVALGRLLQIDDLDVLAQGAVSALAHPSLADAIRGLGPGATAKLVATHQSLSGRGTERVSESGTEDSLPARSSNSAGPSRCDSQKRLHALAETIMASLDPSAIDLAALVELVFRLVGEDVHEVHSSPGALGADHDEPGDLDFSSSQDNLGLVRATIVRLKECLNNAPAQWSVLRRLFLHPSESIGKGAFELCTARAEPHEVAALAMEALDGYFRASRTRWTGQTLELALAANQGGAGSIDIRQPDTARTLFEAVERRLVPSHKGLIGSLALHETPVLRALGARWAGCIGSADWAEFLVPLIEDAQPKVASNALASIGALAPGRVDQCIRQLVGSKWTSTHCSAILALLLPGTGTRRWFAGAAESRHSLAGHLTEGGLLHLLQLSATLESRDPPDGRSRVVSPFAGFPTRVEAILESWPSQLGLATEDLLREWVEHPVGAVREVARRQLAAKQLLDESELESMLRDAADPADRFSATECLIRMGVERLRNETLSFLRGQPLDSSIEAPVLPVPESLDGVELGDSPRFSQRASAIGFDGRVLWALRGASPDYAPALALVAEHLPVDEEGSLEPEAQSIVDGILPLLKKWGCDGALALLSLTEQRQVDDNFDFYEQILRVAEESPLVASDIHRRASLGQRVSTELLKDLEARDFERDLEGLARTLQEQVFPPGWPMVLPDRKQSPLQ